MGVYIEIGETRNVVAVEFEAIACVVIGDCSGERARLTVILGDVLTTLKGVTGRKGILSGEGLAAKFSLLINLSDLKEIMLCLRRLVLRLLILLQVEIKLIESCIVHVSSMESRSSLGRSISWVEGRSGRGSCLAMVVKVLSLGLIEHIILLFGWLEKMSWIIILCPSSA